MVVRAEADHGRTAERADHAQVAIDAYLAQIGNGCEQCAILDLLADLMHLCDRRNEDFDEILTQAREHYAAETS
jgi:hypothetical protein